MFCKLNILELKMSQEIINNLNKIKTANDLIKILRLTPLISPNMAIFSAVSSTVVITVTNKVYDSFVSFMMSNDQVQALVNQFVKQINIYESGSSLEKHCYNLMDIYYQVNSSSNLAQTNRDILMKLQDEYSREIRITQDFWSIDIFSALFNNIGLVKNEDIMSEKNNKRYHDRKISIKSSVERDATFPIWFLVPINFENLIVESSSFEILTTPMRNLVSMYKDKSSLVYMDAIEENPAAFVECFRTLGAINDKQTTMAILRGLLRGNDENLNYDNLYAMRGCIGELSMKIDTGKAPETYSEYRHSDIRHMIDEAYRLEKHEVIVYMSTFVKTPYTLFSIMSSGFRSSFDVIGFMLSMIESRDDSFFKFCIECVKKIIETPGISIHKNSRDSFSQYKYRLQINTDKLEETQYIDVFKRINTLLVKSSPGTDAEENYEISSGNSSGSLVMIEGVPDVDFEFYGSSFYIFYDAVGVVKRVDEKKKRKNFTKHIALKTVATYQEIMENKNHYYHDFLNALKKKIPGFEAKTNNSLRVSTLEQFMDIFKFDPLIYDGIEEESQTKIIRKEFDLIPNSLMNLSPPDMIRFLDLAQSLYESIEFLGYRRELKKIMTNIDTILEHHKVSPNIGAFLENSVSTIHGFITKHKLADDENLSKFKDLPKSFMKKEQVVSFFQPIIDFYRKKTLSSLKSFSRFESDARRIVLKNLYEKQSVLHRISSFFNDIRTRGYNKENYSPARFYDAMENSYNDVVKLLMDKNSPITATYQNTKDEFPLLRIMEVYKRIISYTDNFLPTIIRQKSVKEVDERKKNKFGNLVKEEKQEQSIIKNEDMYFDFFLTRINIRRGGGDDLKKLILALHAKLLNLKKGSTKFQNPFIGNMNLVDSILNGESTKSNFTEIENRSTGPVYYLILLETRDMFLDFTKKIDEYMKKTLFNLNTSIVINQIDIDNAEKYIENVITTKKFFNNLHITQTISKDDHLGAITSRFSEHTLFQYAPIIGNVDNKNFFAHEKENIFFSKLLSKYPVDKYISDLFDQSLVPDIEKIYRIMNIRFSDSDQFLSMDYVIQSMKVALKYIDTDKRSNPEIREYSKMIGVDQNEYLNDDNDLFDKTKAKLIEEIGKFVSGIIESIISHKYSDSMHSINMSIKSKIPDSFENIDRDWYKKAVYLIDDDILLIQESLSKVEGSRFILTKEQYDNETLDKLLTTDDTDASDMKKYVKTCFEQIMLNRSSVGATLKEIFIADFLPSTVSDILTFDKQYFYKTIVIPEMRDKNYETGNIGKAYENISYKYGKQFKIPDWRDIYNFAKKQVSDKALIVNTMIIGSAPNIINKNYQLLKNDYVNVFLARPREKSREILLLISISDKNEFFYEHTLNFGDMMEEKTALSKYEYDDDVQEQRQSVLEEDVIEETVEKAKEDNSKKGRKIRAKKEKKDDSDDDGIDDQVKRTLKMYGLKKFSGYDEMEFYPPYDFTNRSDIPPMITLNRDFFDYDLDIPNNVIDKENNLYYHFDKPERLGAILFYHFKADKNAFYKKVYDYLHGLYTKYMFYAYSSKSIQLSDEKGIDVYHGFRKQEISEKIDVILYYFDEMVHLVSTRSNDVNSFFDGEFEREDKIDEPPQKTVTRPTWFLARDSDSDDSSSSSSDSDDSSSDDD